MRKISLLIALIWLGQLYGQSAAAPSLPKKLIRISTPKMSINAEDPNVLLLKMEFNGAIPKSRLSSIKLENISSISLVYSRYKLSETFDQLTLNGQRMDKLYSELPSLKNNTDIQWYWVEQTGCDDPEACNDYFHGFVITLKSEIEILKRETEIDLLEYYTSMYEGSTDTKKMDSLIIARKLPLIKVCDTVVTRRVNKQNRMAKIKGWDSEDKLKLNKNFRDELELAGSYSFDLILNKKGKFELQDNNEESFNHATKIIRYLNDNLQLSAARFNNKKINTKVSITLEQNGRKLKINTMQEPILPDNQPFELNKFLYTVERNIRCEYMDTSGGKRIHHRMVSQSYVTPDLIFKVFDRNKQWKNCLIVTDVTGSMYPYLAQFQLWHKLHLMANSGNHDFVFFNDGDNKPDHVKEMGSVGGIYYVNADNYDELNTTMTKSMRKGGGGDCPENNIEAVLDGLKKNPNCKEVIMIADNAATPRDLALLDQVKVPIRLVLCGTQFGINTDYLNMIRKNKGSIHTIENDLKDLGTMLEGETIEIEGNTYILNNGNFVLKPANSIVKSR